MSVELPSRTNQPPGSKPTRRRLRGKRAGIAVVMVLGLLAITLALSYSMLRGQVMTAQLQQNFERSIDARYAAQTGMHAALRKLHEADWQGVDVPLHGTIDEHTGYDITYTTGDPSLTSSSPDWQEYPFRVTVRVVGYAEHPDQPTMKSRHTLETVVQLVRRAFNSDPNGWNNIQPYALYQWNNEDLELNLPFRVEGNAFLRGTLRLAQDYPPSTQRSRYFSDLNLMRIQGRGDYRPFSGVLTLRQSQQYSSVLNSLHNELGTPTLNTNASSNQPISPPGTVTKYRLYPGGKEYDVPSLQGTYGFLMHSAAAGPDPLTNPLGVFRSDSWMTFGNNAKITGTLISPGSSSDMSILGTGIEFKGYTLPPLEGSNQNYQLPALVVRDDVRFYGSTGTTIEGLAIVWDQFEILSGSTSTQMNLVGKLVTSGLQVRGRDEWENLSSGSWTSSLVTFLNQILWFNGTKYYPQWMQQRAGIDYQPQLTVKPSSGVQYRWQDWSQPVYVKGSGDTGLRWNIMSQRTLAE